MKTVNISPTLTSEPESKYCLYFKAVGKGDSLIVFNFVNMSTSFKIVEMKLDRRPLPNIAL